MYATENVEAFDILNQFFASFENQSIDTQERVRMARGGNGLIFSMCAVRDIEDPGNSKRFFTILENQSAFAQK
jgi:hypothetical protein